MSIQLGAAGIPIDFAVETYVADPKPNDQRGAVRQRARWMTGQKQVIGRYARQILRLIARGPAGWSLLSALLLKPKTLVLPLKAGLTGLLWLAAVVFGSPLFAAPAALGTLSLAADLGVFLYGLRFEEDREGAIRTLMLAPLYVMVWMRSMALSAISGDVWHRVRPVRGEYPEVEPAFFGQLGFVERYLQGKHQRRSVASMPPVLAESGD
jgi:hypothetical protein